MKRGLWVTSAPFDSIQEEMVKMPEIFHSQTNFFEKMESAQIRIGVRT